MPIGCDTSFTAEHPASPLLSPLPPVQSVSLIASAASNPAKNFFLRRANPIQNRIQIHLNKLVNLCLIKVNNPKANPILKCCGYPTRRSNLVLPLLIFHPLRYLRFLLFKFPKPGFTGGSRGSRGKALHEVSR
jgi:hypothetical protein